VADLTPAAARLLNKPMSTDPIRRIPPRPARPLGDSHSADPTGPVSADEIDAVVSDARTVPAVAVEDVASKVDHMAEEAADFVLGYLPVWARALRPFLRPALIAALDALTARIATLVRTVL
jgi:hypothetical protein